MRPLLSLLVLLAFAGCRVEDDGARSVNEEFAKLQADARASGGIAVLLTPGKEARAEVYDSKSPIFGSGVSIPVKAVPADSSNPVLVIKWAPKFSASSTADTVVSRAIDVRMLELFGRSEIVPALPIQVYMPFTDSTGLDRFNMHIGVYSDTAEKWSYMRNEFVESSRNRVRGRTTNLGTMVALEAKQPILKNTTFYRITQAGKLVCQGELTEDSSQTAGAFLISGTKTGVISLKVRLGIDANYYGEAVIGTNAHLEKPSGDLDVTGNLNDDESRLTVSCGSAIVTSTDIDNQRLRELKFKDWYTAYNLGAAPCTQYVGHMCITEQGEATAVGRFDFTDDADPLLRAQLTIDRSFGTLDWQKLQ